MASAKLTMQDKKDLNKFSKFFALKFAQIIVQSRLGQKCHTKCKPFSSGTDWFNLAIKDIPEVTAETKRALCGDIVTSRFPLCVEISLKTVEGDSMLLEIWCLSVLPEQYDHTVRVISVVYNGMGVLLKSLISVTRTTPAYKLSRRQGSDSYVMCYRIFMGEPQLHSLGEDPEKVLVGQISTPLGTLHLSVNHRTKMTISPQHTGRQNSIMLKSDHFHKDLSPRHTRNHNQKEEDNLSLNNGIKIGAFADPVSKLPPPTPEFVLPSIPFGVLLTQMSSPKKTDKRLTTSTPKEDDNGNNTPKASPAPPPPPVITESRRSSASVISNADDFIMVDLKTPFAVTSNATKDVSTLIRECQCAPPLQTFLDELTLADQAPDIIKTMEEIETYHIPHYDEMLHDFINTENNN